MRPFTWHEGMSDEETKNGAYWERNMLAVMLGVVLLTTAPAGPARVNGWYKHEGEGFDGWSRVISLWNGRYTFHVPDDFDIGLILPEIEPNWDGHTTEEKWNAAMKLCAIGREPSE